MSVRPIRPGAAATAAVDTHVVNRVLASRGAIAGCFGAGSIALWFLLIDAVARTPLWSPSLVGQVLLGGIGPGAVTSVHMGMMAGFSLIHCAAFAAFGVTASFAMHIARVHSASLVGVLGMALVLQTGVVFVATVVAPGLGDALGWLAIGGGNVAAAITMGLCFSALPEIEDFQAQP